jgi:hypothetical protein
MDGFWHVGTFEADEVNSKGAEFIRATGQNGSIKPIKVVALADSDFSDWTQFGINVTQSSPTHDNIQKLFTLEETDPQIIETAVALIPYEDDGGNLSTLLYSFEGTSSLIDDSYRIPYPQIGATSSLGTASFRTFTEAATALSNVGGFIYYWDSDNNRDVMFRV